MWFLLLWLLGLLGALASFMIHGFPATAQQWAESFLLYQFVITFGLVGVIGLVVNIIWADNTAQRLGWPGGPFQIKYGFSQVGLGVMGVLSIWYHGSFWAGTIVTMYIYGLSGLWSHTRVMIQQGEWHAGEAANIVMDIAYQTFLTVLSIYAGGIW